jgi:hypothetical protein
MAITMVPLFPVASGFGSPAMDNKFLDITVVSLRQAITPLVSGGSWAVRECACTQSAPRGRRSDPQAYDTFRNYLGSYAVSHSVEIDWTDSESR